MEFVFPNLEEVEIIARDTLRNNFQYYRGNHQVRTLINCEKLNIQYLDSIIPKGRTSFNLDIKNSEAHLKYIELFEFCRGQGIGWALYSSVQELSKKLGCKTLVQTPYGGYRKKDNSVRSRRQYLLDRGYQELENGQVILTL